MGNLGVYNVHKSFEGVNALNGITLDFNGSSIIGLIGPNGSGKTTLFNVITGFYPVDIGEIHFNGENITGLKSHNISLRGLVRTFQITRIFPKLTVLENMLTASKDQEGEKLYSVFFKRRTVAKQEADNADKAFEILKFLEIFHLRDEYGSNLSGGQLKLLELGRALMMDPDMLLLDEPVAGVNPTLANKIFDRIVELKNNKNIGFVIVEHNMDVVMSFCDRIYVMDGGKIVAEGVPEEIQRSKKVIEAYLGGGWR
jgi:ABC-type branched-subunit amino acid transport system ATPase component